MIKIKKLYYIIFFLSIPLFLNNSQNTKASTEWKTKELTILCSKDAYIWSNLPDNNFGTTIDFRIGKAITSGYFESFFYFNISSILNLEKINSINFIFTFFNATDFTLIESWFTQTNWNEDTITWNNKPSLGGFLEHIPILKDIDHTNHTYTIELEDNLSENTSISICFREPSTINFIQGYQRESYNYKPKLVIFYSESIKTDDNDEATKDLLDIISPVVIIIIISSISIITTITFVIYYNKKRRSKF